MTMIWMDPLLLWLSSGITRASWGKEMEWTNDKKNFNPIPTGMKYRFLLDMILSFDSRGIPTEKFYAVILPRMREGDEEESFFERTRRRQNRKEEIRVCCWQKETLLGKDVQRTFYAHIFQNDSHEIGLMQDEKEVEEREEKRNQSILISRLSYG